MIGLIPFHRQRMAGLATIANPGRIRLIVRFSTTALRLELRSSSASTFSNPVASCNRMRNNQTTLLRNFGKDIDMAGLTLTRGPSEAILIGDDIKITVVSIGRSNRIRLKIEAPKETTVLREELLELKKAGKAQGVRG